MGPGSPGAYGTAGFGPAGPSESRWFVVWANPQGDERAQRSIERAGFEARVLIERFETVHNRTKAKLVKFRRLLPRYVFVRLPLTRTVRGPEAPFGAVRRCDGVERFLNMQGRPLSIRPDELGRLLAGEAAFEFLTAGEAAIRAPLPLGTRVRAESRLVTGEARVVAVHNAGEVSVVFGDENSNLRSFRMRIDSLSVLG